MLYMFINVVTATCVCISTNRVLGYSIIAMTYQYVNNNNYSNTDEEILVT